MTPSAGYTDLDRYRDRGPRYQATLAYMSRRGIRVDRARIAGLSGPLLKRVDEKSRDITRLAGRMINPSSSHDLRTLFYRQDPTSKTGWTDRWGDPLPPKFWTDGGSTGIKLPSTDEEALEHWKNRGEEVATAILEYRAASKIHSTYVEKLEDFLDGNSRVHTTLSQLARTGRLTSRNPNLQNQPARSEEGKAIRNLFIAGPWGDVSPMLAFASVRDIPCAYPMHADSEMVLIVADYDQVENKIAAQVSGDPVMLDAILTGKDLHCITAAGIAKLRGLAYTYADFHAAKKADHPTAEQEKLLRMRSDGKAVGFGILYGIGPMGLAAQLGLPVVHVRDSRTGRMRESCPEGEALIEAYFNTYPGLKEAIERKQRECRMRGYVTTITGRKRRLPEINSENGALAGRARRQAFNTIIQGTASDIIESVMVACEEDVILRQLGVRQLLQVHDELIFECPKIPEVVKAAKERIRFRMTNPFADPLDVPLTISMHDANSWGEAK